MFQIKISTNLPLVTKFGESLFGRRQNKRPFEQLKSKSVQILRPVL